MIQKRNFFNVQKEPHPIHFMFPLLATAATAALVAGRGTPRRSAHDQKRDHLYGRKFFRRPCATAHSVLFARACCLR